DTRARLFFAYFLLAKQKKVGAPPGAHPGPGKQPTSRKEKRRPEGRPKETRSFFLYPANQLRASAPA
ncbi:hypothetical protein, partial [Paracidovorax avenae]|uniref:hypothetical protein n=1 Tax=Paracidovorax avenae TaxID=80867 RepID=UPI001F486032